MDMSYIIDSGQNRLYTTFPNIFLLLSTDPADLSYIQKNHFSKKSMILGSKMCSRGAKSGSIGIARQSRVRINIPYKPTNLIFGFWNIKLLFRFCLTTCIHIVKQNVSKNFMFQNPKIKFVGFQGMFMRTWDYRGFLIEPILALLEHIFDPKIWDFF